ncbi:MAG: copper ABC transporter ATP-binding protein [Phycisphaerae bacterium]|nr:MAG: copper ABC transporter ATP-binding protein [Phycisphaerae bacterium]
MIRIENVTKRFGRVPAVDGVSLDVPVGESLALWGSNGAGKTTLLRCVLGLLPYQGHIRIGEHDARADGKAARMLLGYVPQELGFYDDLRAGEALRFFARLKGLRLARSEVHAALANVGLDGHHAKRIRELSGGMKQRLALAIALVGDPPVLILDEVTASLDACGRGEFVAMLARLRGQGRTMLFASHRLDEVTALATRVVMLERGKAIADLPPADMTRRLGAGSELHLLLDAAVRAQAVALLRERGFEARLNGRGILVPVPESQKAGPFRVLAEARITIADFDLVPADGGHTHSEGTP